MAAYQVATDHQASYPYSVKLKAGEQVVVTAKEEGGWVWCTCHDGRGAWVPKEYLVKEGGKGTMRVDYSSAELTAHVGDRLLCTREADGWVWCVNQKGESGWLPKPKLNEL
jgi:uncharacterized protein YgiM (DUF1202 family)